MGGPSDLHPHHPHQEGRVGEAGEWTWLKINGGGCV